MRYNYIADRDKTLKAVERAILSLTCDIEDFREVRDLLDSKGVHPKDPRVWVAHGNTSFLIGDKVIEWRDADGNEHRVNFSRGDSVTVKTTPKQALLERFGLASCQPPKRTESPSKMAASALRDAMAYLREYCREDRRFTDDGDAEIPLTKEAQNVYDKCEKALSRLGI